MRTRATRQTCALAASLVTLAVAGCGTSLETILFQTGSAAGRTFVDRLLTDVANSIADSFDAVDSPTDGTGNVGDPPPDDSSGGDSGGPADGGGLDTLTGDPADGGGIYSGNGCAGCHCADAAGGCALDAPSLAGGTVETIDGALRGDAPHPVKVDLSDQDIADLEAYLTSLG